MCVFSFYKLIFASWINWILIVEHKSSTIFLFACLFHCLFVCKTMSFLSCYLFFFVNDFPVMTWLAHDENGCGGVSQVRANKEKWNCAVKLVSHCLQTQRSYVFIVILSHLYIVHLPPIFFFSFLPSWTTTTSWDHSLY